MALNQNLLTPEERTKAYMRGISSDIQPQQFINPDYQSQQINIKAPEYQPENIGVGSASPDTQPKTMNMEGDAYDYIKNLSNKFGISQQFGNLSNMYKSGSHPGLDIKTPVGTEIASPIEGRVMTGYDPKGWGRYVQVHAPDGTVFQFSHLSDTSDLIKEINKMKNNLVKRGQVIGKTGGDKNDPNRGLSTGAHLDVSVKRGGKFINPLGRQKQNG